MEEFFYNIKLNINDLDNTQIIKYRSTLQQSLLNKSSDYEVAVERAYIPMKNIPIFFFEDNTYKVGIKWVSRDKIKTLYREEYITYNYIVEPEYDFARAGLKPVWNIFDFTDAINNAIIICIDWIQSQPTFNEEDRLEVITPFSPQVFYPKLDFLRTDPNNQQFISISKNFFFLEGWQIYMNDELFNFFNGFSNEYAGENNFFFGTMNWRILKSFEFSGDNIFSIVNQNNDKVDLYKIYSEFSTTSLWNAIHSIVVETDMPIITEYFNSENGYTTNRLITDFVPIEETNNRSAIQYFNNGNLRFYQFFSDLPLNTVDIQLYWIDKKKRIWNFIMSSDEFFSLKLHFRKKQFHNKVMELWYKNFNKDSSINSMKNMITDNLNKNDEKENKMIDE